MKKNNPSTRLVNAPAKKAGTLTICSRGHKFYKNSDRPVCPRCWPGYYRKREPGDFPQLAAPALRALLEAAITTLTQLTRFTESELLKLHGLGPNALAQLRAALRSKGLSFKK